LGLHDLLHDALVAEVARHRVDLEAVRAQPLGRLLELLRAPCGDGQGMALLAEHSGDRQPDPARSSSDDRCTLRHVVRSSSTSDVARHSIRCAYTRAACNDLSPS
jgi:hypothetical protein